MLDALLEEEFGTKKKLAQGDKGLDLDALIEEAHNAPPEKPLTWSDVGKAAKPAVLPTLGQIAGTVGGMAAGPFAPAAVPTLEALGGMGGEKLNQILGITEPSNTAIAVQGILPLGFRGAQSVMRVLPPSTNGAALLNEIAPIAAREKLGQLGIQPGTASFKMQQATSAPVKVDTGSTMQEINNVYGTMSGSSGDDIYKGTKDYLARLYGNIGARNKELHIDRAQKELRDLGERLGGNLTPTEKAALTRVKVALENAIENDPNGKALIGARREYLRENVHNDLVKLTFKQDKNMSGQGDMHQFNAKPILDMLEGKGGPESERFAARFQKAFTPEEQQQVKGIYRLLNKFDKLAPAAGVNAGSYHVGKNIGLGLSATGLAAAAGASPSVAGTALVAGMALPPAMHATKIFSLAMQTSAGRDALYQALKANPGKPIREVMQKVAVALSASEDAQETYRPKANEIQPFANEQ